MAHGGFVYMTTLFAIGILYITCVVAEESSSTTDATDTTLENTTEPSGDYNTTMSDVATTPNGCGDFQVSGFTLALTSLLCLLRI